MPFLLHLQNYMMHVLNDQKWTLRKKGTIHQVNTMPGTTKNVLPGHNHLLTTGTGDPTLWLSEINN